MNGLKAGAMLVIPTEQEIARVDVQEARQLRLSHAMEWKKPSEGRQEMPVVVVLPVEGAGAAARPAHPAALEERAPVASSASAPIAKPAVAEPGKGENEELKAILLQLQVITRVLESNQAQQDRMEQRIAQLEQARKEWDFLRERINDLERAKDAGGHPADGESGAQLPPELFFGQPVMVWMGAGAVVAFLLLGLFLTWLGRRWNQKDQWQSLQAVISATAQKDPQLLRDALQQAEPAFDREFAPTVHTQKLDGVSPAVQKRTVAGDVEEAASKLQSMTGPRG
ncbi:MAG: hypothetical protein H7836_16370 [Magnetococcus sp. YQC-3]